MQGPPHRSPKRFHQHPRGHQHAQPTKAYNPRHPERTLLYRTIAEHFETWLELASAGQFDGQGDHHTPPAYVEKAFRKYLECGIFAHGFARVRCDYCGDDFLVAFSCKGRGVCPSCNTRRMAEAAAHLTDHVYPRPPVRQWVPHSVTRPICTWVRSPCVHRFGSCLNTHVHFHVCVWSMGCLRLLPEGVIFHAPSGLDESAIATVQANVRKRILRAFAARGHMEACDAKDITHPTGADQPHRPTGAATAHAPASLLRCAGTQLTLAGGGDGDGAGCAASGRELSSG